MDSRRFLTYSMACVMFSLVGCSGTSGQDIKLNVFQVSGDKVKIHWQSPYKKDITECELSVNPSHGENMQVIQNYIPSENGFIVDRLKNSTDYTIFVLCHDNKNNKYSSNFVSFRTGNDPDSFITYRRKSTVHRSGDSSKFSDYPQVYREKMTTSVSALDIALGVIFSLFGVIIIVSGAFYFWRKYQRRQRIQRFIRHQDTDSFPDLQAMHSGSDVQLTA